MGKLDYYDTECSGTHTIKVTLQCEECAGSYTLEVGGNCHGFSVIETAVDMVDNNFESDCNLRIFEDDCGECYFSCDLKDKNGNVRSIDACPIDELTDMVVAVEIVEFTYD